MNIVSHGIGCANQALREVVLNGQSLTPSSPKDITVAWWMQLLSQSYKDSTGALPDSNGCHRGQVSSIYAIARFGEEYERLKYERLKGAMKTLFEEAEKEFNQKNKKTVYKKTKNIN